MALSLSVSINRHRNSIVDIFLRRYCGISEQMEAFGCDEATVIITRSQYNMDLSKRLGFDQMSPIKATTY